MLYRSTGGAATFSAVITAEEQLYQTRDDPATYEAYVSPRWVVPVNLPQFLIVIAVAMLAFVVVPVAYVVWARIVGLEPKLAQWWTDQSRLLTMPAGLAIGAVLGVSIRFLPTMTAGLAAIVLLATSTFAGLLLFEFYTERSTKE